MTRALLGLSLCVTVFASAAPAQRPLYVADGDGGIVAQVPSGGGSFTAYATGFIFPVGVAMTPTGVLYVSACR